MFSNTLVTTDMIQPDMLLIWMTSPAATAIAPRVMTWWLHNHSASPTVAAIMMPFMVHRMPSMTVNSRICARNLTVWSPSASAA